MAVLELVNVARDAPATPGQQERARYLERLHEPCEQLDFVIDERRLSEQLSTLEVPHPEIFGLQGFDFLSVADLVWPEAAASALRQLAGVEARSSYWPLAPGRLPLYVCPMCGDLGCGAITVEVVRNPATVTWRDFRVEDGLDHGGEEIDLGALGPFTFDAAQYETALLQPIELLDALIADEAASKASWEASRRARPRRRIARVFARERRN